MITKELFAELQAFVNKHIKTHSIHPSIAGALTSDKFIIAEESMVSDKELESFIKSKRKLTFHQVLFGLIDEKGANDSDIYKKAGIDRRHFSKIRSNRDYRPRKNTVVALALALRLNKKGAYELLRSAGYSLSDSDTFDLVIQFCLEKSIYDIHDVNMALDFFSLKPLVGEL